MLYTVKKNRHVVVTYDVSEKNNVSQTWREPDGMTEEIGNH